MPRQLRAVNGALPATPYPHGGICVLGLATAPPRAGRGAPTDDRVMSKGECPASVAFGVSRATMRPELGPGHAPDERCCGGWLRWLSGIRPSHITECDVRRTRFHAFGAVRRTPPSTNRLGQQTAPTRAPESGGASPEQIGPSAEQRRRGKPRQRETNDANRTTCCAPSNGTRSRTAHTSLSSTIRFDATSIERRSCDRQPPAVQTTVQRDSELVDEAHHGPRTRRKRRVHTVTPLLRA